MQITFNSLEEVFNFVDRVRPTVGGYVETPGECRPGHIDPVELARILGSMLRVAGPKGSKIHAIKVYRAVTGQGLKESKDAIERFSG
jgi:hypothetical protein